MSRPAFRYTARQYRSPAGRAGWGEIVDLYLFDSHYCYRQVWHRVAHTRRPWQLAQARRAWRLAWHQFNRGDR